MSRSIEIEILIKFRKILLFGLGYFESPDAAPVDIFNGTIVEFLKHS